MEFPFIEGFSWTGVNEYPSMKGNTSKLRIQTVCMTEFGQTPIAHLAEKHHPPLFLSIGKLEISIAHILHYLPGVIQRGNDTHQTNFKFSEQGGTLAKEWCMYDTCMLNFQSHSLGGEAWWH